MSQQICSGAVRAIAVAFSIALEMPDAVATRLRKELCILYRILADTDITKGDALTIYFPDNHEVIANRIIDRIGTLQFHRYDANGINIGWDSLEGVMTLIRYLYKASGDGVLHPDNITLKRVILALFNKRWLGDGPENLSKILRLLREVEDGLDTSNDQIKNGLIILFKNLQGRRKIKGTWYHLEFLKRKGLRQVEGIEVPRDNAERGIDAVINGFFYELKSYGGKIRRSDAVQIVKQLSDNPIASTPDGWKKYFFVSNDSDPSVIAQNGGVFLQAIWKKKNGVSDFSGFPNIPQSLNTMMTELKRKLRQSHPNLDFEDFMRRNVEHLSKDTVDPGLPDRQIIEEAREFVGEKFFQIEHIPDVDVVRTDLPEVALPSSN